MTGMTRQQVGRGVSVGYVVIAEYLRAALIHAGCEVDLRPVIPGEDLTRGNYDALLMGLAPPKGNPARHLYGALWAMMKVHDCGGRLMFYVDDWHYRKIASEARGQVRNLDTMFNAHRRTCRAHVDEALEVRDWLEVGMRTLAGHEWPTLVYPSWSWGDPAIFHRILPVRTVHQFDPGAWALPLAAASAPVPAPDPGRERRWVCAALTDHSSWVRRQSPAWPVTAFGPRTEQGRVPETRIREEYARCWGVLSPGYTNAGSGWWRVRALHATESGGVFLGDPDELGPMGPEWRHPLAHVESLPTPDLRALSDAQRTSLHRWVTPADQAAARLYLALEQARL